MDTHSYSISEEIESIDVLVKRTDFSLTVKTEEIDTAKLELIYSKSAVADYTVCDGTLKIHAERKHPLAIFSSGGNKIILTLPKKYYENLTVDSSSGDIDLESIIFNGNINIGATSSDIEFTDVESKSLICDVTSGNFSAENLTVKTNLNIKATSGDTHLRQISASALKIDISSGEVKINESSFTTASLHHSSGNTSLKAVNVAKEVTNHSTSGNTYVENSVFGFFKSDSTSGKLEMQNSDAGELEISTNSGDVTLTLLTPKNFVVETTSGKKDIIGIVYTDPLCKINTTSGDVTVRIAE